MSKKRKKLKAKLHEQLSQIKDAQIINPEKVVKKKKTNFHDIQDKQTEKYVKKDINKIIIISIVLFIIIAVFYYLSIKTSYIKDAADWISQVLNIS